MDTKLLMQFKEAVFLCLSGLPETLKLTFLSVIIGFVLALFLAIPRANNNSWLGRAIWGFTYFFTGTPLLVQLYIIYYGLPEFAWLQSLQALPSLHFMKNGFFWAWLAFTLNTAAYSTEIFAGAIKNTPTGDIEAAKAYGMTRWQLYRHIIMPASLRRALPAYSNEVIMAMHSTALASLVTLMEVTGQANSFFSLTYEFFPAYLAATLFYLGLTFCFVMGFRLLEIRYLAHLKRLPQAA